MLPFQGANLDNRQLSQGVAVGLEYIAPSVRTQHQRNGRLVVKYMGDKWLKTIYIPAQRQRLGQQNEYK